MMGLKRGTVYWLTGLAALSITVYLTVSALKIGFGFPLDDAWIHQVYARNLAETGQLAFIKGTVSAGSTSPLWSGLLAIGYLLYIPHLIWAYLLGAACYLGTGIAAESLFRKLVPYSNIFPLAGTAIILEWHLAWSSVSGMETAFFCFFVSLFFNMLLDEKKNWFVLGLIAGLATWVRPDGITLFGPLALAWLLSRGKSIFVAGLKSLGGALVFLLPYLGMNFALTGALWPNTFYAKQAEYAIYQQIPLIQRFLQEVSLPLVGAGAVLLPACLYWAWKQSRSKLWLSLTMAAWGVGYLFLYAWKLPVTYQHGRYVIPVVPSLVVCGVAGMAMVLRDIRAGKLGFILTRAWALTAGIVLIAFWVIGARAYSQDVAVIETEMVATAEWLEVNTPPGALIAVHDIGAIGYFTGRDLVDMAGLVTPEVIPFIRDEARLVDFLGEKRVSVLVTFPNWYPELVRGRKVLYSTNSPFSGENGNMTVYAWP